MRQRTILVTNADDVVLCMAYLNEHNTYSIVEPADGSIKMELFDFEPTFKEVVTEFGNVVKVDRQRFTITPDSL